MAIEQDVFTKYYSSPNVSEVQKSTARRLQMYQNEDTMVIYDKLLNTVVERTGIEKDVIEELMNVVAFHESDRTMDPRLIHYENPGRGLFGYEIAANEEYPTASGAGRTAINRTYNALGGQLTAEGLAGIPLSSVPEFMEGYFSGPNANNVDVDFSLFTEEEQKILFLADHLQAGSFDQMGRHLIKSQDYDRWWANFHHQGREPDVGVFRENWEIYNKTGGQ